MVNVGTIASGEETTFTNEVDFAGQAADAVTPGNWTIDSRSNGSFIQAATVGYNTNRRIRSLNVTVKDFDTDGLLPIAGAYSGTVCVTVDPSGSLTGTAGSDDDGFCGV